MGFRRGYHRSVAAPASLHPGLALRAAACSAGGQHPVGGMEEVAAFRYQLLIRSIVAGLVAQDVADLRGFMVLQPGEEFRARRTRTQQENFGGLRHGLRDRGEIDAVAFMPRSQRVMVPVEVMP